MTISADESEDVDILSDFVPSNISQSNTASTAKPSDATDSEDRAEYLSTFAGDHNYCCTTEPTDVETEKSSQETETSGQETAQSGQGIAQSGNESSPKVIIESQQGEQVSWYCMSSDLFLTRKIWSEF